MKAYFEILSKNECNMETTAKKLQTCLVLAAFKMSKKMFKIVQEPFSVI